MALPVVPSWSGFDTSAKERSPPFKKQKIRSHLPPTHTKSCHDFRSRTKNIQTSRQARKTRTACDGHTCSATRPLCGLLSRGSRPGSLLSRPRIPQTKASSTPYHLLVPPRRPRSPDLPKVHAPTLFVPLLQWNFLEEPSLTQRSPCFLCPHVPASRLMSPPACSPASLFTFRLPGPRKQHEDRALASPIVCCSSTRAPSVAEGLGRLLGRLRSGRVVTPSRCPLTGF